MRTTFVILLIAVEWLTYISVAIQIFFSKGVEETKGEGKRKFWKKITFIHSIDKKNQTNI